MKSAMDMLNRQLGLENLMPSKCKGVSRRELGDAMKVLPSEPVDPDELLEIMNEYLDGTTAVAKTEQRLADERRRMERYEAFIRETEKEDVDDAVLACM